jgi:hypothetical protein
MLGRFFGKKPATNPFNNEEEYVPNKTNKKRNNEILSRMQFKKKYVNLGGSKRRKSRKQRKTRKH